MQVQAVDWREALSELHAKLSRWERLINDLIADAPGARGRAVKRDWQLRAQLVFSQDWEVEAHRIAPALREAGTLRSDVRDWLLELDQQRRQAEDAIGVTNGPAPRWSSLEPEIGRAMDLAATIQLRIGDELAVGHPHQPATDDQSSVTMTLGQVREIFGYASDNAMKGQAERVGLTKAGRGAWSFRLSAMTADERKRYEQGLAGGLYDGGKRR